MSITDVLDALEGAPLPQPDNPVRCIELFDGSIREMTLEEIAQHVTLPYIPDCIDKIQIKRQFVALGRWDEFKALKATSESMTEDWDLILNVEKGSDFTLTVSQAMNLDIQNFFTEAKKL